jgi:ribosomal protein L11 methyltransferase
MTSTSFYTRLQVVCDPSFSEILMAEIAEVGFDSFLETEKGFEAYVENEKFDKEQLQHVREKYAHVNPMIFYQDKIQKQNWNEEWEKNLQPIFVEDKCVIRAEFHKIDRKFDYEIIITPKMSFGTGHHQTTYLMIKNQMAMNHAGKRVMDAGCGTSILSIMASKLGAREVEAFDIDDWSVINGEENVENNRCKNIRIQKGKISEVDLKGTFDIILANINKNVLLAELQTYSQYLAGKGQLLLSGFYVKDIDDLIRESQRYGLTEKSRDERETWAALLLEKA